MLLLLLSAPANAEDAFGCTAFGPVDFTAGTIHGPEWTVGIVEGAATIRRRGDVVWEGPAASLAYQPILAPPVHGATAASLSPRESTALELARIVEAQMWAARVPQPCLWGGTSTLLVPPWADPIPLAADATVAWSTGAEALVVSPAQRTWYRAIAATPEMAADLAKSLSSHTHRAVFWKGDAALAVVSTRPIGGEPIPPAATSRWDWDPFLSGVDSVDRRVDGGAATLAAGRELVAALNERRVAAGLGAVAWDDKLGWAAMAHCVYIDWTEANLHEYHAHDEDPDFPVFVGETPGERGGASEVIVRTKNRPPTEAIEDWLETPFHRGAPMHPGAVRAGACATPGGARVMEVAIDRAPLARFALYPPDNASDVPLVFDGREDPDPVPLSEHPLEDDPDGVHLVGVASDRDGRESHHGIVDPCRQAEGAALRDRSRRERSQQRRRPPDSEGTARAEHTVRVGPRSRFAVAPHRRVFHDRPFAVSRGRDLAGALRGVARTRERGSSRGRIGAAPAQRGSRCHRRELPRPSPLAVRAPLPCVRHDPLCPHPATGSAFDPERANACRALLARRLRGRCPRDMRRRGGRSPPTVAGKGTLTAWPATLPACTRPATTVWRTSARSRR